ncbi:MAG: amidohydrolase family protein [Anaerolineae bacterium]
MTTQIIHAEKVVCLDGKDTIYSPGSIKIESGKITAVGPRGSITEPKSDNIDYIDLGNKLIMPGLVNAHTHTPMVLFRGMAEGHSLFDFDGWYNTIRVVEEVAEPEMASAAVLVSCAEMIRTGTTTFADQYFWMEQVVPAVRQSGLRAALAYGIVELGDPKARERELTAASAFLEELHADDLISGWVGPHAYFVDNSTEAMQLELGLAAKFGTGFHIHLSTSGEEDRYCQEKFGRSAIAQLAEMGMLDRPNLAAHCLTIPEADYPILAQHPFTAVMAPSSAMRNAAGVMNVLGMLEAGINLALGTDNVTNNNSYDMFKEMQLAGKLMALHHHTPNALATRKILEMATLGGAKALGMENQIGSLEAGKQADLIALDLDEIGWAPAGGQDIYTALVYGISGMHICDTMVNGRWLYQNGEYQTIDYAAARQQMESDLSKLQQRLQK